MHETGQCKIEEPTINDLKYELERQEEKFNTAKVNVLNMMKYKKIN